MRATLASLGAAAFLALPAAAFGTDVQGTISLHGQVLLNEPVPGIDLGAVRVTVDLATDATGPGVHCSVDATTSDTADAGGLYPDGGAVSVQITMGRGGPQVPDGTCLVTLHAAGWDGAEVTAHGVTTLFVTADQIGTNADLAVPVMALRASKAHAGLAADCKKWAKRTLKLRDKCNATILKLGGAVALEKCKDAGPAPDGCDVGHGAAGVLSLSHGSNDQQVDPAAGEAVDADAMAAQLKCQAAFAKAATKFFGTLAGRIQAECVKPGDDARACRDQQVAAARKKLDAIDDCTADVALDGGTGRDVASVGAPCFACIDPSGVIDHKCMKSCFEDSLGELADGLVGDVPVCGDGILQNGEFCDDGNTDDADCCSASCGILDPPDNQQTCGVGACQVTVAMCMEGSEVACVPGDPQPESDPTSCSNGVDDDCDGLIDVLDPDCIP